MYYATRSIEVIAMIEVFDQIGTPVYRELLKSDLPDNLQEFPDSYLSTVKGCEWSLSCLKLEGIYDFGWYVHQKKDPRRLSAPSLRALNHVATLKEQLELLLKSMRQESNYHSNGIHYGDTELRVIFPNPGSISEMETRVCEWGRVFDVMRLVQNSVGHWWRPRQIGFIAAGQPCADALTYLGNTQVFGSQNATWITIESDLLATRAQPVDLPSSMEGAGCGGTADLWDDDLVAPLKATLRPYFASGRPSIKFAAELAGTSARTLQRRLNKMGLSYSQLLDQCVFETASSLLKDPANNVTDVALSLGYEDASHFSRSFRRISGVSPSQFRAVQLASGSPAV